MYENDPRVKVKRLVESFAHGHGRIVQLCPYYGFYVKFGNDPDNLVYFPMHENGLKFFNDEETDYLLLTVSPLELWDNKYINDDSIIVNRNHSTSLYDCGKVFTGYAYRILYSSGGCSEELGYKDDEYLNRFCKKICNVEVSTEFRLSGSAKVYSFKRLTN